VSLSIDLTPRQFVAKFTHAVGQAVKSAIPLTVARTAPRANLDLEKWLESSLALAAERIRALRPSELLEIMKDGNPHLDASTEIAPTDGQVVYAESRNAGSPVGWKEATVFRFQEPNAIAMFTGPDASDRRKLFVYCGQDGVELPAHYRDALAGLLAKGQFTIADVRATLPASVHTYEVIEPLCEIGALVPLS
jgi:hypothetical protein